MTPIPTIHLLAADIAGRIREMRLDSNINNAAVIETLLEPIYRRIKDAEDDKANSRRLLCLVWNHMHGQNIDGTRRPYPGDDGCAVNWNKLSDEIGTYLESAVA